jgi:hypothetical protein
MALKIALNNIPVVYAEFMEKHYFPKLKALEGIDPKTKKMTTALSWLSVFFSGDIIKTQLKRYDDVISMLGLIDEGGFVDLNKARDAAKFLMEKTGSITIYGFSLDSSDVDVIYNIARPLAVEVETPDA